MAERESAMTPAREDRRHGQLRQYGWSGSPFAALQRMADEMDRIFEDFGFGRRWGRTPLWREQEGGPEIWAPEVDVFQRNNELTIKVDLPGLKREEVSVDITDEAVTIHGERRREREEEREGLYRSERSYGSFYRVIQLPEGAITEQAKATFQNGVLEIKMPAPPATKGRRLEITEVTKK